MELREKYGQGMIFTLVDLVAFFDWEDIFDVMSTLYQTGVNRKASRMRFKLNQDTEIKVKTSAGMTEPANVGDVLGQGTAGAALVSQLNLDHGLHIYFEGSSDELYYHHDVGKLSDGVNEAQATNLKMTHVFQEKGLQAHPDKTYFIVFGNKKYKNKIEEDLKINPLYLGGFPVQRKTLDKYLGQILHEDGVQASAKATIEDRVGSL